MRFFSGRARAILLGSCASIVFLVLVWQLQTGGSLLILDQEISSWVQAHRSPELTLLMLLVTHVHAPFGVLVMALLASAVLASRHRWRDLVLFIVTIGGGMLLNLALKQLIHRARPSFETSLVQLDSYSFPSGHAIGSTLFYASLALLLTRTRWHAASIALGATLVLAVAASRVYLGAHYLSDVAAGIALALVWTCLCWLIRDLLWKST